ncbi:MAG: CHAP domain-containing protein [Candidatus Pacebacteria bacterium]|nr:CHAP domain-containing protein [Candidatus Paceibacterota bacterium]
MTDNYYNSLILAEAGKQSGKQYNSVSGQCKEWARMVVQNATGKNIPATLGNNYQWQSSSVVRAIWSGYYICPASFPCIFGDTVKPGQIIQLRWQSNFMSGGPHTAIVKSVTPTKMQWYDCNFIKQYYSGYHDFTLA